MLKKKMRTFASLSSSAAVASKQSLSYTLQVENRKTAVHKLGCFHTRDSGFTIGVKIWPRASVHLLHDSSPLP